MSAGIAATPRRGPWPRAWRLSGDLRVLKRAAIVLPVLFLALVDLLRHSLFWPELHTLPGFLLTYLVLVGAVVAFSSVIFGLIRRLQAEVAEQNRQLTALNGIVVATAEKLGLEDLLSTTLDHVLEVMRVDAGLVCIVDLEHEEHSAVCHRGFSPELARQIQRAKLQDDPLAWEVVRTGRPVVLERVFEDPRVAEAAQREGIRSAVSVPLKAEGEVNGILALGTRTERRFSPAEREFLSGLGGHLGMAIQNAVLYEGARLRNRELGALLTVGKAVTSSFELDEVLTRALDTILEVTSAQAAELWLCDGDEELVMRSHRGACPEAFLERTRFRLDEGLPGVVARSREPLVIHDLPAEARFLRQEVVRAGFHTFCALPLRYQDRLVGVLAVAALSERALRDRWELRLLEGIGEWVALAIANARLHQQVQDVAVVQERERIARELHDGIGQVLGYVITQTLALKKLLADGQLTRAAGELASVEAMARELYADVREGILGLRTAPHRDGGLIPALRSYVERYAEASGLDVTLHVAPEVESIRLSAAAEIQLSRIIQEALSNVRRHARATAASVSFRRHAGGLRVEVADDGQGFDPTRPRSSGWPRFGLQTMRERAESIGGTMTIETAPGQGTRVIVGVPLEAS